MNAKQRSLRHLNGPLGCGLSFDERSQQRQDFICKNGLSQASIQLLAEEASSRRYYRLTLKNRKIVLMDTPLSEKPEIFSQLSHYLNGLGLSAPLIYAEDLEQGFLLLEDFGETLYTDALQKGISAKKLYLTAIESLAHLHEKSTKKSLPNLRPYNLKIFMEEVQVFIDWYLPTLKRNLKSSEIEEFKYLWKEVFESLPSIPRTLVLRDVLIDNLMWLPDRKGVKKCGFLDFQDALYGPICYDLVSLLEDARRDIDLEFAQKMLKHYSSFFPQISMDDILYGYFVWGAQRSTKIIGLFTRLALKNNKPKYLCHIPRVWRILMNDLKYPQLSSLQKWFDTHLLERTVL